MDRRVEENMLAEEVRKIAEKDLGLAEKLAERIQDHEAKVMAFLNLHSISKRQDFVEKALKFAKSDEDYLRIVEVAGLDLAELIKNEYRRDLAYASLFERTTDLRYAEKIRDRKIASASMKRVSEKLFFPENLELAKRIPDPYYRCLALAEISEREKLDLKEEIAGALNAVENPWLKKWLRDRLIQINIGNLNP